MSTTQERLKTLDRWYALTVIAGNEGPTKIRILERLKKAGIVIPGLELITPEQEITVQNNKGQNIRKRKMSLPGYMLVRCRKLDEKAINTIVRVKGVMEFLGGNDNPTPLPLIEVRRMLNDIPSSGKAVDATGEVHAYAIGDTIEITDGPLEGFEAIISEWNAEKGIAAVQVEIFGQSTKAQLKSNQMKKA